MNLASEQRPEQAHGQNEHRDTDDRIEHLPRSGCTEDRAQKTSTEAESAEPRAAGDSCAAYEPQTSIGGRLAGADRADQKNRIEIHVRVEEGEACHLRD